MNRKHAILSASAAHRWIACPPSARLEERFPEESSEYAREGTAAHELAEICARHMGGLTGEEEYAGAVEDFQENSEFFSAEMMTAANTYAALVYKELTEAKKGCPDPVLMTETKLDYSEWVEGGFGTGDCVIIAEPTLTIIDFKYGRGVAVAAEGNPQMRLYALGALAMAEDLYDIKKIRTIICQPRISEEPSAEEISVKKLKDWAAKTVRPAAELAYDGKGEYAPSEETCRFCRARKQCRARAQANIALFDEAKKDAALLSPAEAGELLKKAADMKSWLADLESYAMDCLMEGKGVPGWKLVEGRSIRKLADEGKVVAAMTAAGYKEALLYERKLLTLTQMEKDFGKKQVAEILAGLIEKPAGKPTLAKAEDKRPEYNPAAAVKAAFDEQ